MEEQRGILLLNFPCQKLDDVCPLAIAQLTTSQGTRLWLPCVLLEAETSHSGPMMPCLKSLWNTTRNMYYLLQLNWRGCPRLSFCANQLMPAL